jgi:hypothetical protein
MNLWFWIHKRLGNADQMPKPETVTQWLDRNAIMPLNVAGPEESKFSRGIYQTGNPGFDCCVGRASRMIAKKELHQ